MQSSVRPLAISLTIGKNVSCHSGKGKTTGIGNRLVIAKDSGRREGLTTKGHEGTFGGDGNSLYLDYSGGYRAVCAYQNS